MLRFWKIAGKDFTSFDFDRHLIIIIFCMNMGNGVISLFRAHFKLYSSYLPNSLTNLRYLERAFKR